MPVIPALRRLEQEDCQEFKASLGYRVKSCPKEKRKEGRKNVRKKGKKTFSFYMMSCADLKDVWLRRGTVRELRLRPRPSPER